MRYKEDWEQAKKRLTAFWNQEIEDRCCISVKAFDQQRFSTVRLVNGTDEERFDYWTNPDRIIERNRLRMQNTYYGGEAFPCIFLDLGAGGHAGFFKGAKYYFGDSVWFFPSVEEPGELEFDKNSFLYQKTLELARAFVQDSQGDYMVSMPDTTGNADALSHLLGPENLMISMMEDPEAVQGALLKIQGAYESIMTDVYQIVKQVNEGGSCVDWLSTWAPGYHAQMQCDMSVMIANDMFREFIMPELRAQCTHLQYPLYHFDGVEQLRHLEDLLSIPELRAIQWTQVAGQPSCLEYLPQLRRIQQAGKSLLIPVQPEQVQPLMENLSSRGLYLVTTVSTREEADRLIREVERMTHD